MQDRGIGMSINFHPVHLMTYYRERFGYKEGDFPVSESISKRIFSIPMHPYLEPEQLELITESIIKVIF